MRRLAIIVDTREQNPLDFSPFTHVRVERRKLWPGDYSLKAATRLLAIERKSVSDLVGTLKTGYAGLTATTPKRFDCELLGLAGVIHMGGRAFVLVEPDKFCHKSAEDQINSGDFQSMIPPTTVMRFIETIRHGWRVPVILANSRQHAAEIVVKAVEATDCVKQSWRPFDRWMDEVMNKPMP